MYTRTPSALFLAHLHHAKQRGIEFRFTKEEWVAWWQHHLGDDWMDKRGPRRGQFVMARKNDCGPYEASNVCCVLSTDNHAEKKRLGNHSYGDKHPFAKLTTDNVLEIRKSAKTTKELADFFGMDAETIRKIRKRERWAHI